MSAVYVTSRVAPRMNITRNADGTLVVPIAPTKQRESDDETDTSVVEAAPTSRVLHPGEGGYDEALAEWDSQQNPDRGPAVSTASGREEAMAVVHEVAESADHEVAPALEHIQDVEASAEALRHVLVGGVHAVEDFAKEVAKAEGGEPLPAHEATKIIGEVLAAIDE